MIRNRGSHEKYPVHQFDKTTKWSIYSLIVSQKYRVGQLLVKTKPATHTHHQQSTSGQPV